MFPRLTGCSHLMSRNLPPRCTAIPVYTAPICSSDVPCQSSSSPLATVAWVDPYLYIIGGCGDGSSVYRLRIWGNREQGIRPYLTPPLEPHYPTRQSEMKPSFYHHPWEECPSMNSGKLIPRSVAVNGKIYVFGQGKMIPAPPGHKEGEGEENTTTPLPIVEVDSHKDAPLGHQEGEGEGEGEENTTTPCPFVEVYSPEDGKWDQILLRGIPSSTVEPILAVLSGSDGSKHVLFQPLSCEDDPGLYTYDITNKTLSVGDRYKPFHRVYTQGVVIDGVLYNLCYYDEEDYQEIVGYSLNSGDPWVSIPVIGLAEHLPLPVPDVHLVGIGQDMLCVIWTDNRITTSDGEKEVFIMTFKMLKRPRAPETYGPNEPGFLVQASHVSSKAFVVPGIGRLLDCLVLQ